MKQSKKEMTIKNPNMIKFCGFRGHEVVSSLGFFTSLKKWESEKKEKKVNAWLGSKLTCLTPPHWWCYLSLEVNSSFGYWSGVLGGLGGGNTQKHTFLLGLVTFLPTSGPPVARLKNRSIKKKIGYIR